MSAIRKIGIPVMASVATLVAAPAALATASASPAAHSASAVRAAQGKSPEARNYFILYLNSEPPGGHRSYACNGGARYVVPAITALGELYARNNCNVRVWLHLNANGTGRALCIRPHSTAIIRRPYRQIWISRNTASC